jgi:hypothetical protein
VKPLGPAVLLTARPRARLFHLVFGSHIGRALGADSGEKSGLASDIDTATVESLNALDPKRPIREAVSFNDPGRVKTLRGITAPGILRLVVTLRAKKCKNSFSAQRYNQIRFRFHTA